MSAIPTGPADARGEKEKQRALKQVWSDAKGVILASLIEGLTFLPNVWINTKEFFNEESLPVGIDLPTFNRIIFRNCHHREKGVEVYFATPQAAAKVCGPLLLRWKHGADYWLWGCEQNASQEIGTIIDDAMDISPGSWGFA